MGWFWGNKSNKTDPTDSLSPDFKDFLTSQQPRPYVTTDPAPVPEPKLEQRTAHLPDTNKSYVDRPLPKESLFQDGRYKDLWKTYVPQTDIATSTTTPVDRIIERRKERRHATQHAAWENCAFEHEMQLNCLHSGGLANRTRARMTMCRQETKAFNRCFQLQSKFLQSLGYYSSPSRSEEEEEQIQMHADKLYHRMMDYEAAVDEAKRDNKPIPPLTSVFDVRSPAPAVEELQLPTGLENRLNTPLHDLPAHQRELAVRAALQEARMRQTYVDDYTQMHIITNKDRQARQEWLVRVFGEPIGKFIVPDVPKPSNSNINQDTLKRQPWEPHDARR